MAETRLIWIDLETMGLAHHVPIVEVAMLITDLSLDPITPGFSSEPASQFECVVPYSRHEWSVYAEPVAYQMHHETGLLGLSLAEFEKDEEIDVRDGIIGRMALLDAALLEFVVRAGFKSRSLEALSNARTAAEDGHLVQCGVYLQVALAAALAAIAIQREAEG